jgi:hypothetical protein
MGRTTRNLILSLALAGIAALAAACGAGDDFVPPPPQPQRDVLLWTRDAHGDPSTHWVRGNRAGGKVLGARDGIVLSLPEGLFEIDARDAYVPTCDCGAEPDAGAPEDACPAAIEAGAAGKVLVAVRQEDGAEFPITQVPDAADADGPLFEALEFGAEATASVGPYLFVRSDARSSSCGSSREELRSDFTVFDLSSGGAVDLLSEKDLAAILAKEQTAAFKLFADDPHVDAKRPEDLELTAMEPVFIAGAGVAMRYQFSARSSFEASDGAWGAYTRSVEVPAGALPAALAPYAAIPDAVDVFMQPSDDYTVGGFFPVSAAGEQLAALARLFSAEP